MEVDDYFAQNSYCDACPLVLKKVNRLAKNEFVELTDSRSVQDIDFLFLLDGRRKDEHFLKIQNYIKYLNIKRYVITNVIGCHAEHSVYPIPTYTTYTYCNKFDISKYNPKVVIAFGNSIFNFTRDTVFSSWREFNEIVFNNTYFISSFETKRKYRIYPVSFSDKVFLRDSFEYLHFEKQIEFAKKYIENFEAEDENKNFISLKFEYVEDTDKFFDDFKDQKELSLDTETNDLNVYIDDFKVGCITVSFDGITGYYLPFDEINKNKLNLFLKNKYLIGANPKYDISALEKCGVFIENFNEDITLLFHLLNTERSSNSLKSLAWLLGLGGYEKELEDYKSKHKIVSYLDIPVEKLMPYACTDAIVTMRLWSYAKKYLIPKQPDVYKLYKNVVIPTIPVFYAMEKEGFLIDTVYLNKYNSEIKEKIKNIEKEIFEFFGYTFEISSGDQLGRALEKAGLKDLGQRTKKGIFQTNEKVLDKWKKKGYKIAEKLLEYKGLLKLSNTYVGEYIEDSEEEINETSYFYGNKEDVKEKGLVKYIMSDGRIHGSFLPAITSSWRSASSKPNLQNQPKQGEEGKKFRSVFKAPDDYIFCEADYSGFQIRLAGIASKENQIKDIFLNKGGDFHSVTAINLFCRHKTLDKFLELKKKEPYKTYRFNAKTAGLAFIFGQTAFAFKEAIEKEWKESDIDDYIKNNHLEIIKDSKGNKDKYLTVATKLRNLFFEAYPDLMPWITAQREFAEKNGYVESNIFKGCVRHLPELLKQSRNYNSDENNEKLKYYAGLKNIAVNSPIQGGEAIIVYKALRKIYDKIKEQNLKSKLVGCVHDSIVLYLHKTEIEKMFYIIKEAMEVFDFEIPILMECEIGEIWGFSQEVTESNIKDFVNNYR